MSGRPHDVHGVPPGLLNPYGTGRDPEPGWGAPSGYASRAALGFLVISIPVGLSAVAGPVPAAHEALFGTTESAHEDADSWPATAYLWPAPPGPE